MEPIQNETTVKQMVIERLDHLPLPALHDVLSYVEAQLNQSNLAQQIDGPQGTVQDLLACAGTWHFEPGELEEILADIEQGRLLELAKDDILLD